MQTVRQETILSEAAIRFRKHASLSAHQKAGARCCAGGQVGHLGGLIEGEDLINEP